MKPYIDAVQGIIIYNKRLKKNETLAREEIKTYQHDQLKKLVKYAVRYSPFYRKLYQSVDIDHFRLQDLPVVNKKMLMENFEDALTCRNLKKQELESYLAEQNPSLYQGQYYVLFSGGSSGSRGLFVYNRKEWRVALAGLYRWNKMMNASRFTVPRWKVASITSANPMHASCRLSASFDFGITRKLNIYPDETLEQMIDKLNRFQPQTLIGYSSVIYILAEAQLNGDLNIKPSAVSTNSEMMSENIKNKIQAAWGVVSFSQYSMTELLSISGDCRQHTGNHIFEDLGIINSVDKKNKPVKDGMPGEKILITNLYNYTQPIINYEIDDILAIDEKECRCGCNFKRIVSIQGREMDMICLNDKNGKIVRILSIELLIMMEVYPQIQNFHILFDENGFTISIVMDMQYQKEIENKIQTAFQEKLYSLNVDEIAVRILFLKNIPRNIYSGKQMLFENRMNKK